MVSITVRLPQKEAYAACEGKPDKSQCDGSPLLSARQRTTQHACCGTCSQGWVLEQAGPPLVAVRFVSLRLQEQCAACDVLRWVSRAMHMLAGSGKLASGLGVTSLTTDVSHASWPVLAWVTKRRDVFAQTLLGPLMVF